MPTPTTRLRVNLQDPGSNLNVWGQKLNDEALVLLDEAIAGVETISLTAGDVTLTSLNYASDQSRNAVLVFDGSPVAARIVTIPSVENWYIVHNKTTQQVTIKTSGDAGVAIAASSVSLVYSTGSAVSLATPTSFGGARLTKVGTPTAADDAAVKSYVDTFTAHRSAGGFKLTNLATPTVSTDAATKSYADSGDAATIATVQTLKDASAASATLSANSATASANSATASATSASNASVQATNSANSATASATSATAAANSATSAATSAATAVAAVEQLEAGSVVSVNGMGGAVTLTAADVGAAATSHTHTIANITSLQTTLDGKAGTAVATASVNGLMSSSDKSRLDAAVSTNTASRLVIRDASGNFAGNVITANSFVGPVTGAVTGNASTATALSAGADRTKLDAAIDATQVAVSVGVGETGTNTGYTTVSATSTTTSNGGKTFLNTSTGYRGGKAAQGRSSGKWYFEVKLEAGTSLQGFGLVTASEVLFTSGIGQAAGQFGFVNTGTDGFYAGSSTVVNAVTVNIATGSVIGIAVDLDSGKLWASHDGVWIMGDPATGTSPGLTTVTGHLYPASSTYGNGSSHTIRLLGSEMSYPAPMGFAPWAGGYSYAGTASTAIAATTAVSLAAGTDKTKLDSAVQSINSKTGSSITLIPSDINAANRAYSSVNSGPHSLTIGARMLCNTSSASFTANLPSGPTVGSMVEIVDANGTFGTNPLTIGRNGMTIMTLSEDMIVNTNNASFALVYTGSTWRLA
jgi:hypothetical protein